MKVRLARKAWARLAKAARAAECAGLLGEKAGRRPPPARGGAVNENVKANTARPKEDGR